MSHYSSKWTREMEARLTDLTSKRARDEDTWQDYEDILELKRARWKYVLNRCHPPKGHKKAKR
jgi:hypothetical protein